MIMYIIGINLIGFLSMWIDKRKSIKQEWRTPEKTLFYIALLGGSIGSILGMYLFRHKTKKLKFTIGMPVILICQIILMAYLILYF